MARGVPVACSNRASLPEVADDAALLFDPEDVAAMPAALERLLATPSWPLACGPPGRSGRPCSPGSGRPSCTLASYERALAALACRRMLGGRPPAMVAREILRRRNYLALGACAGSIRAFARTLGRYFLGPRRLSLRLRGPHAARHRRAHASTAAHDMWTVNEVFCRQDYGDGARPRVVVDIGSNIGISALFFLTRNPAAAAWLFEPVPRNIERLRLQPGRLRGALHPHEAAVAERGAGRVRGRGERPLRRHRVSTGETIEVECAGINEVLDEVLDWCTTVDVLKIDTEGTELEILSSIRPDLLRRVRTDLPRGRAAPERHADAFDAALSQRDLVLRNRRSL